MRKKLRGNYGVESVKFKVKSFNHTFNFQLLTFDLFVLLFILVVNACSTKEVSSSDTYTCPMHPTVVSDKPGVCPVCAMDLVRKARPGEEVKITEELARLIKSTNEVVVSDIKTVRGEYKSMPVALSLQGIVTYDTRNIYNLSSRIAGRLEKVYVKYMFQPVRKGQKIAEVYSAELVNAQREYIYLLKNDPSNNVLIEAAKTKLLLLGVTDAQLNKLESSREIEYTFSVYSPYTGYVVSENQSTPVAAGNSVAGAAMTSGGMGMGAKANMASSTQSTISNAASSQELTRAGSYVSVGQILFSIVNTESLWIEFNAPVNVVPQIKIGDQLEWFYNNQKQKVQIDFIEPFFSEGEDFVKIRSYIRNKDLPIGQLVEVTLATQSKESLWVPLTAVIDLGNETIVFVKERGLFKPRKIKTGVTTDKWIEVQSGLASGDEIAMQAQYLIDSENFIKTSN